jgi:hypothetical protein
MWLKQLVKRWMGRSAAGPGPRRYRARQLYRRPLLEALEARQLLASYTAASVADLIADINAANTAGGANTITLVAGTTFTLTSTGNGSDGLPPIAANDSLGITGNGDTIARSTHNGTPAFRLFDVASGASLTLANLTLQGGFNAAGGGIYSAGSLTLTGCTIQKNKAIGVDGGTGQAGGAGLGGGIYVAGGTASLTNVTLSNNTAQGGKGGPAGTITIPRTGTHHVGPGPGGNGLGGGMYVAGGSVTLRQCSVTGNSALGGKAGGAGASKGQGEGGGLYLEAGAAVGLDAYTVAHVLNNQASTDHPDIDGSYTPIT